jgi:hypothetical protein
MADRYRNSLFIRERGKLVPYASDHARQDRSFRNLKGRPELVDALPGLDDDPALRALLKAVNGTSTGLFSVAAAGEALHVPRGHQHSGYLEFALNSVSAVQQIENYFPVFAMFNRYLHLHRFQRASFEWEIEDAAFTAVNVHGFACSVYVRADLEDSAAMARANWEQAMEILGQSLCTRRGTEVDPIYGVTEPQRARTG